MKQENPTRLTEQSELPRDVRRALESLRREGEGDPRLLRVAQKLGPLLDAAPPALPAFTRLLRFGARHLTASKVTVLLLAAGGSVWFALNMDEPAPKLATTAAPAVQVAPTPALATQDVVETEPEAPTAAEPQPVAAASEHVTTSAARPAARTRRASVRHEKAREIAVAAQPSAASTSAQTATASQAVETAATPVSSSSEPAPERPKPPRVRSEAELLFEARKVLGEQPRTALSLLQQHAHLYERGQLAPEREVLAIEALRKLGQTQAAEERARQFKLKYPGSFHAPAVHR